MDYEKEYKDALARMELCVRTGLKITPEFFFPELAESEDEKIINAIIGVLKLSDVIDVNVSHNKMFAYLEKQKEQMLKDAFVDNYVVHDGRIELEGDPLPSLDPILLLPYPQFKPGDKVRIIVVKED